MTEAEYVAEMEFLEQMLGTLHQHVNAIADREAAATAAQHPVPYSNAALTATKARLLTSARDIVDKMEALHTKWTSL